MVSKKNEGVIKHKEVFEETGTKICGGAKSDRRDELNTTAPMWILFCYERETHTRNDKEKTKFPTTQK